MATAIIHSTARLIEALGIGNTTAHNIGAHNKLAMILIVLQVWFVASFPLLRPEPGDNILCHGMG